MRKIPLIALVVLHLSSCAVVPDPPFIHSEAFDESEVSWAFEEGSTTIEGSAYIIDRMGLNGTTHTCVGYAAKLIPKSGYAEEFFTYLFGNLEKSFWNYRGPTPYMTPGDLGYGAREENCDIDGRFVFYNVPSGTYYLVTTVYYVGGPLPTIPPDYRGGMLLERVEVKDQERLRVVMTP